MPLVTDQKTFDALYNAHLPPAVAAMLKLPNASLARINSAAGLAAQGFTIDYAIEAAGMDPYDLMKARAQYGMTWVPNMTQQPLGSPGGIALPGVAAEPGQIAYDANNPPRGSIKVSLASEDYPPFNPPAPVPVPPAITSAVGLDEGSGFFAATVLARELYDTGQLVDSQAYTDPNGRGNFFFHASPNPFAPEHVSLYFTTN